MGVKRPFNLHDLPKWPSMMMTFLFLPPTQLILPLLFYQLEGEITVRIQEDGKAVDIPLKAGDMYLHPPKVPHSPMRSEGSIGLVIERVRKPEHNDGLMWFCDNCNNKLHDTYFKLTNIENDFLPRFREFYGSEELRTCNSCGHVMETDPRFVNQ